MKILCKNHSQFWNFQALSLFFVVACATFANAGTIFILDDGLDEGKSNWSPTCINPAKYGDPHDKHSYTPQPADVNCLFSCLYMLRGPHTYLLFLFSPTSKNKERYRLCSSTSLSPSSPSESRKGLWLPRSPPQGQSGPCLHLCQDWPTGEKNPCSALLILDYPAGQL